MTSASVPTGELAVWRVTQAEHAETAFTGEGSRLFGGRWNGEGRPVVYTAGSAGLAAMELLVHLDEKEVLGDFVLFEARFAAVLIEDPPDPLPAGWSDDPPPPAAAAVGDAWLDRAAAPVLRLPSAVLRVGAAVERNFLLNPEHPNFGRIEIGPPEPFQYDPRLVRPREPPLTVTAPTTGSGSFGP